MGGYHFNVEPFIQVAKAFEKIEMAQKYKTKYDSLLLKLKEHWENNDIKDYDGIADFDVFEYMRCNVISLELIK